MKDGKRMCEQVATAGGATDEARDHSNRAPHHPPFTNVI